MYKLNKYFLWSFFFKWSYSLAIYYTVVLINKNKVQTSILKNSPKYKHLNYCKILFFSKQQSLSYGSLVLDARFMRRAQIHSSMCLITYVLIRASNRDGHGFCSLKARSRIDGDEVNLMPMKYSDLKPWTEFGPVFALSQTFVSWVTFIFLFYFMGKVLFFLLRDHALDTMFTYNMITSMRRYPKQL